MKVFLDTSVLVEACLAQSPSFHAADRLLKTAGACTSGHALAEAYATLSGDRRLKIGVKEAAQMVSDLAGELKVEALKAGQYLDLVKSAPAKGIYGGSFFDALHAQTARDLGCTAIYTINLGHFRHVAPDLEVLPL